MYTDTTGLNERIALRLPNGEEYSVVWQYWTLPKFTHHSNYFRNILNEPLPDAIHDMDCAMYWLCKEAAAELDSSLRIFHSAKIWVKVCVRYESTNPDAPNYKAFEATIGKIQTSIGEYPMNEGNLWDSYKPYRAALRILAEEVLACHANLIRNESGYVLSQIIDCQLGIVKFNAIGSAYKPLPKRLALKKAIVNVHNSDERCFGYAVLSALKDTLSGHHKSEARYYNEADFEKYHLDQIQYPVSVQSRT